MNLLAMERRDKRKAKAAEAVNHPLHYGGDTTSPPVQVAWIETAEKQ
jgi:hypothetical protein